MNFIENIELFLAAFIASLFGQGGGILYTPIQIWNGRDFHDAAAISLFLIVITSLASTIIYRKSQKVDWMLALLFEGPTIIGAYIGGYLSHFLSSTFLRFLLSVILVAAAYLLLFPKGIKQKKTQQFKPSFWIIQHKRNGLSYTIDLRPMVPVMLLVGAITGMTGIGGGILKKPIMLLLFNIPMPIAVGSSAFMVGITATGGLLGHISHGGFDWKLALVLVGPVLIGALAGSYISLRIKSKQLVRYFGIFILLLAIYLAGQTVFVMLK